MLSNNILKLALLNLGIVITNIVLFSPGLFDIQLSGDNTFGTAVGYTAILMSLAAFVYGNYKLIFQKEKKVQISDIRNSQGYTDALKQSYGKKTFDNDVTIVIQQVERFEKKKEKIMDILLQRFSPVDSGYDRFKMTIVDVEYIFYANIQSILNKINAFDEEDYLKINTEMNYSMKFVASRKSIHDEYISFVKNAIENNEEIILKLDSLLLELSNFNTLEIGNINNMTEIKEMDELIKRTKYYQ